jgi:sulfite reductase alpha subunit-like flavoprotein
MRCQQYGHTKTYCNKSFMCVKCGGPHNSKECNKHKDMPAKCSICGGSRPANYKGCEHYHNLIKGNNPQRIPQIRASSITPNKQTHSITHHNNPQQCSYADVTKNHEHQAEDAATTLKNVLEEFKGLFAQLLHQNSIILNMLTTLINKTH